MVVPSFTLDQAGMSKIPGVLHYEERMLSFLHLLRDPGRRLVYVTSEPLPDLIVDYALGLVRALPVWHARRRLTLLHCGDASPEPLTRKVLARPGLVARIRRLLPPDPADACVLAFNGSPFERTLALRLGAPLYACDPDLSFLGSKSGARALFQEAGVPVPRGLEGLRDRDDVVKALAELRAAHPDVGTAVIKLNEGFGAGGNALFPLGGAPRTGSAESWIRRELPALVTFATPPDSWEHFAGKLDEMGGVVEERVEGSELRSPSVQVRVTPGGEAPVVSSQDQVFEGEANQTYAGAVAPADPAYRHSLHELGLRTGRALAAKGALGIASVDFVSRRGAAAGTAAGAAAGAAGREGAPNGRRGPDGWAHYAVEINLRMGGGTAPLMFLLGAVEGAYDPGSGDYLTPDGQPRYYVTNDRLRHAAYRALTAEHLLDTSYREGVLYDPRDRCGTIFHMLGALPDFGKLATVVIGTTPADARHRYRRTVAALDAASAATFRQAPM
ncbi:hypothetical protein G5C65_25625 [Streptomyces sp. SB3404]|uniref:ATP-grasp domain-containing protein n=1 Tax=Streptomyces boncukensis TaxID=2711219 RepID=A0A6G4X2A2_9ACTN|nr:hypothetical protein [Streptomyces boncukensis]